MSLSVLIYFSLLCRFPENRGGAGIRARQEGDPEWRDSVERVSESSESRCHGERAKKDMKINKVYA